MSPNNSSTTKSCRNCGDLSCDASFNPSCWKPGPTTRPLEEIRIRLIETIGEIRRMDGKCTLIGFDLPEEWEVYDALCTERDTLQWVINS